MDVVFTSANWLFLAKLHIHSETTLQVLRGVTKQYGTAVRKLQKDTLHIQTMETPSEVQSRKRRAAKAAEKTGNLASLTAFSSSARPRPLNINTIKNHQSPHVVEAIEEFGATVSYSTWRVSWYLPRFSLICLKPGCADACSISINLYIVGT